MPNGSSQAWVPDPARIDSRQAFGRELSLARDTAGLTVRDVARRIGVPASTLGGYFSGAHLPGLRAASQFEELLVSCSITDPMTIREWHRALRRVRRGRPGGAQASLDGPGRTDPFSFDPPGANSSQAAGPVAPDQPSWPMSSGTISIRPPVERLARQPRIRGRAALLEVLASDLDQPVKPGSPPRVHVLHGLGGCGKSTVALALAQASDQLDIRTWWIDAGEAATALAGLQALAIELGATLDQLAYGSPADQLWRLLAGLRSPWLLVIDNADDAARVLALPEGQVMDGNGWLRPITGPYGTVVVTTRDGSAATWGSDGHRWVRLHPVGRLSASDGALLLQELVGEVAGPGLAAMRLSDRLGGLPLALRLVGQYLGEVARMPAGLAAAAGIRTFDDYLAALSERRRQQILDPGSAGASNEDQHNREVVSRTWELSLDLLKIRGMPRARPLLRLLSCMRQSAVPYGLLLQPGILAASPLLAGVGAREIWLIVEALADLGLVDLQHTKEIQDTLVADTLVLHPLVRDTSRFHPDLQAAAPAYLALVTALLVEAVRDLDPKRPESWIRWQAIADHCASPVDMIRDHAVDTVDTPEGVLEPALHAVCYLRASGRLQRAESECQGLITVGQQILGSEHPAVLAARHELSRVWYDSGQYNRAKREFHLVLAARNRVLGPNHPDSLLTTHYLARAIQDHGQLDEAERYFGDVLWARRHILGDHHPETLTSFNSMAAIALARGRLDAAERLLSQVRSARSQALGDDHPATLVTRYHLATLLHRRGDLAASEAQFRDLDQVSTRQLGAEHPRTLRTRQSLADVLHELGQASEAERLTREVLELRHRVLGYDHPATLVTRHRLALIRAGRGDVPGGLADLRAVLSARRHLLGERHPDTMRTRDDLGHLSGVEGPSPA